MRLILLVVISITLLQYCLCMVNKNVERKIDISTHLVKVTTSITVEGSETDYVVNIDPEFVKHLAYIGATIKSGEEEKELTLETKNSNAAQGPHYIVKLKSAIGKKPLTFILSTVFSHKLRPFPSEITQAERQFISFVGNVYFYSPYLTESQETRVILATPLNILSHTQKPTPVNKQDATLVYGPYKDVAANSQTELSVHYENNSPFLAVTHLTRLIEISHWGNIAVEETLDIRHTGAQLKGSFSRFDYQRNQGGASSVKSIKTVLPAASKDVYYRDEIGNISTSHLRELSDYTEIELRPRFPLFGGWKTHYILGYNVPTYEYLYRKESHYGLRMRFVDHIYDDQVIDEMTLKVVLPEAVSNVRIRAPFPVKEGPREVLQTYLDTVGRTVVVVHKTNLVEQHIKDFELYYDFHSWQLVREPLMVIIAFLLLFSFVIVYVRFDFSITKDDASESRMRLSGFAEEVRATQDRRSALYQAYEDAINKYKSSKDMNVLTQSRKKIDGDHQQLTQQMTVLQTKLKQDSAAVAEKVNEIQSLDSRYREQVTQSVSLADRLVTSKITKQVYIDNEKKVAATKSEILQRIETVLASL
jgi:oligosaccharyltransferase complex subunit alpha (ribophorin I)